jgi:hypothetical protein
MSYYRGGDLTRARRTTLWNLACAAVERASLSGEDNAPLAADLLRRVREQGIVTIPRSELLDWARDEVEHRAQED